MSPHRHHSRAQEKYPLDWLSNQFRRVINWRLCRRLGLASSSAPTMGSASGASRAHSWAHPSAFALDARSDSLSDLSSARLWTHSSESSKEMVSEAVWAHPIDSWSVTAKDSRSVLSWLSLSVTGSPSDSDFFEITLGTSIRKPSVRVPSDSMSGSVSAVPSADRSSHNPMGASSALQ